jgi:hypothetical protein
MPATPDLAGLAHHDDGNSGRHDDDTHENDRTASHKFRHDPLLEGRFNRPKVVHHALDYRHKALNEG